MKEFETYAQDAGLLVVVGGDDAQAAYFGGVGDVFPDTGATVVIADADDAQHGVGSCGGRFGEPRKVELLRGRGIRYHTGSHGLMSADLVVDDTREVVRLFGRQVAPDVPEIEIGFGLLFLQMSGHGPPAPEHPDHRAAQYVFGGMHFRRIYFFAHKNRLKQRWTNPTLHKFRFGSASDSMRRCKPGKRPGRVGASRKNNGSTPFPDGCLGRGQDSRAHRGTRAETSKAGNSI